MTTPAERLKEARKKAGYVTGKAGAARVGVPYFTYAQHENGTRDYDADSAKSYARAFGVDAAWLLYGTGRGENQQGDAGPATVPVVGYVQAGAEAVLYSAGQGPFDFVQAPPGSSSSTVAVEIRGESLGSFFTEWLVFYDDVRSPVTSDLHGRLCVVGLPDGRILVKQVKPSRTPGLFHLMSQTEGPILDQELLWAAKVNSMQPR